MSVSIEKESCIALGGSPSTSEGDQRTCGCDISQIVAYSGVVDHCVCHHDGRINAILLVREIVGDK
jgi:hypothetical protein